MSAGDPRGPGATLDGAFSSPADATFTIARIERDREAAASLFLRDRDTHALEQAMSRLDAEEASARTSTQGVSAAEAVAWLQDLPVLWVSADDSGRRLLTEAIFEKVEILGVQSVTIHPTPEADAHGWSEAFGSVPLLLNAGRAFSTDGRGERTCPVMSDAGAMIRFVRETVAHLADLRARSGLTTEQLIYSGRAAGWLVVPSLEPS